MRIIKLDKGEYSNQFQVAGLEVNFTLNENGKGIKDYNSSFTNKNNIMSLELTSNGMDKIPFTEPFALITKDGAGTYTMLENCYFDRIEDDGRFVFTYDESSTITESYYRKSKISKILEDL